MSEEIQEKGTAPAKQDPAPPRALEKMTAKELREYALVLGGIVGVSGMGKDEILQAVKDRLGIVDEEGGKKNAAIIRQTKVEIKEMKAKRDQAREAGNQKRVAQIKKRISRLKKQTRTLATA